MEGTDASNTYCKCNPKFTFPIVCDSETVSKSVNEVSYSSAKFREDTLKTMYQMRNNHFLTDVDLKVGQQILHVHKIVLVGASPYFKAMFTSGLKESDMQVIHLQGVCPMVMLHLVHFMYGGNVTIGENIVCPLLQAANMFQMFHVVEACCEYLEDQMEADNVIGIANFAQQNGCSGLHTKATAFIEEHFTEVIEGEEFLELGFTQLVALIKKDELNVPDEEAVYNSVLRWIHHDPENRKDKMALILKVIRCHYLPPRFLSKQISQCTLVKKSPACKEYLSKVFDDLHKHKPPERGARCLPQTVGLFHMVGGYGNRQSQSGLYCFDVENQQWQELGPMQVARSGLGAVFLRGALYAVAGRSIDNTGAVHHTNVLTRYTRAQGWSTRCSLQQSRNRMGVAVVDCLLYAVGGVEATTPLASVERYDAETDTWTYVSPMRRPRGGLCCAALHRLLYAIGGCTEGQVRLSSVECYNPDRDVWTEVAPLNQARSGAGVAVVYNRIYVIGGHGGCGQLNTVEMYDPEINYWTFVAPLKTARSALAVAACNDDIYAMGGFDGENLLSSVEVYCVKRNEWREGPSMPWGRSGHAVAVPTSLLTGEDCGGVSGTEDCHEEDYYPANDDSGSSGRGAAGGGGGGGSGCGSKLSSSSDAVK